jgi:hypothetical protein
LSKTGFDNNHEPVSPSTTKKYMKTKAFTKRRFITTMLRTAMAIGNGAHKNTLENDIIYIKSKYDAIV